MSPVLLINSAYGDPVVCVNSAYGNPVVCVNSAYGDPVVCAKSSNNGGNNFILTNKLKAILLVYQKALIRTFHTSILTTK